MSHRDILEKSFPGRENRKCKSPEVKAFLVCSKSNKVVQNGKKWSVFQAVGKNVSFYCEIDKKTFGVFTQMNNMICLVLRESL